MPAKKTSPKPAASQDLGNNNLRESSWLSSEVSHTALAAGSSPRAIRGTRGERLAAHGSDS